VDNQRYYFFQLFDEATLRNPILPSRDVRWSQFDHWKCESLQRSNQRRPATEWPTPALRPWAPAQGRQLINAIRSACRWAALSACAGPWAERDKPSTLDASDTPDVRSTVASLEDGADHQCAAMPVLGEKGTEPNTTCRRISFQQEQRDFIGCRDMSSGILVGVDDHGILSFRILLFPARCSDHRPANQQQREKSQCPSMHSLTPDVAEWASFHNARQPG